MKNEIRELTDRELEMAAGGEVLKVGPLHVDIFNGALAVALAEGRPVAEALRFANAAAAISVTRVGAQTSVPSRAEVDAFLANG